MITVRHADERGRTRLEWLKSRHSFSFAEYHDPKHMGFRALRVINDDIIGPNGGFPYHGHQDMEIVTYIIKGALEHRDNLGSGAVIRPGELQRMTAGTGIVHSEFNPSDTEPVRLLQIWLLPDQRGLEPGYEQKFFPEEERRGKFLLLASKGAREGSLDINLDGAVFGTLLDPGREVPFELAAGRYAWVQVTEGKVDLNGTILSEGDGAAISEETRLTFKALESSNLLLFDLA